jgi:putative SOS response-associated peptidase YedK
MCGRYSLRKPYIAISEHFSVQLDLFEFGPRYNIAPGQQVAVLIREREQLTLVGMKWGLVPFWAKDPKIGNRLINARVETVSEKPAFRTALRTRRCILPADGFYEWNSAAASPRPVHFRFEDDRLFGLAGLWDEWEGPGGALRSCTILTRPANEVVAPVHHRMPVMFTEPEEIEGWLAPGPAPPTPTEGEPGPGLRLKAFPASGRVNDPTFEGHECITPGPPSGWLF